MFLFYFFLCFIIALPSIKKGRVSAIQVWLIIIILTLYVGTRVSTFGRDYYEYERIFSLSVNSFDFDNLALYEPSFFIIPIISSFLFGNLYIKISFVVFAFLALYFKVNALKKYDNFFLGIIFYASYLLFSQEMITIRAGVACAIFLYSIKDIIYNNNKAFFVKIVFAMFFHYSSFVFILAWLSCKLKKSINFFYYILVTSFVIAVMKINILTLLKLDLLVPKVRMYLELMEFEEDEPLNIFNFRILTALAMMILFAFNYKKMLLQPSFLTLFKIHILSIALFFILSPTAMVFSLRVFDMLSVVQLLLYPMITYVFKNKLVPYLIMIFLCFINLYYIMNVSDWFNEYSSWLF